MDREQRYPVSVGSSDPLFSEDEYRRCHELRDAGCPFDVAQWLARSERLAAVLQELEEAKRERDELEHRWLGMRGCYDREVLGRVQAEQQVKELQEALSDLLVHIPNGTATDPYKVKAYRVLAGSVEEQKP